MNGICKKLILNVFAFVLFSVLPFSFVRAASQASQKWVCLKADPTAGHTASVSVDPKYKLLPSSNTYVFECLSSSECTSGNSAVDLQVFGKDNYGELNNQYGYNFQGSSLPSNPSMSDGAGTIPTFSWTSSTSQSHERRWLAMNYVEPTITANADKGGGEHLGTFDFESVLNQSDCVSLSWDPYGRVFDSKTLEPVNQATVTLYKKDGDIFRMMTPKDILGGNIINPQVTKEDGGFSFVVPDGTYKLVVSNNNYTFPEELNNLQSNYSKIYSDIYPAQTGVEIVQQGAIQHRDIPLKQISLGIDSTAKLMQYFYDLDKIDDTILVKGRVSHPFAEIRAYSLKDETRYHLLTKVPVKADKMGNFVLKIDQSKFDPTETFGEITVEKTDLTLVNLVKRFIELFIGKVNAQVFLATTVKFEPILNYVEGYAYDSAGKVLPNATVSVYLEFSNKPYYQTTTDDKGYYKISSEFLPSMPYHLSYASTNGQIIPTTNSKFVAQNEATITKTGIKLNQFKNNQGEVIDSSSSSKNKNNNPTNNSMNNSNSNGNNLTAKTNKLNTGFANKNYSQAIILSFVILFLVILAVLMLVYLKKRQNNQGQDQNLT